MSEPSRGAARVVLRALSNVFLGIALGLLAYYLATDALARVEQRALAASFPESTVPLESPVDPFDWEEWESEDAAYWKGLKPGEAFGRLSSPRMGLDAVVVKGTNRSALMKGPGWIEYTDLPGPTGNVGISGHRTTYGAPFRRLDRLRPGDTITLTSPFRVYTYRVRRVFSVTPDRTDVVRSTEAPTLTMTACHPPYSARLRLIAQSELVAVVRVQRGD